MTYLSLLHLSDVHFGAPEQEAAQERIAKNGIPSALARRIANGHRKPDLCIFSGDLAHNGSAAQFYKGGAWLTELADRYGSYLFIVPGNHDVTRPTGNKGTGFKTIAGKARESEQEFNRHRDEIEEGPFLKAFRKWHENLRNNAEGRVLSNWEDSVLGSVWRSTINSVPMALIGLNSASLSFEDNELGKLVCDTKPIETVLAKADAGKELIMVVTHHPAGRSLPGEQYLSTWNDKALQKLLLQSTGPHLYLHGHLHEQNGVSLSLSTGQSLALYAAGAAYQPPSYPIRFAIYDIDFVSGEIKPWVFEWNDISGEWGLNSTLSYRTRAVLPRPPGSQTSKSIVSLVAGYVTVYQQMFNDFLAHFGHEEFRWALDEKHKELKRQFGNDLRGELEDQRDAAGAPEAVRRAIDQALGGDWEAAIANLKQVVEQDPRQQAVLLRMLVTSPDPRHWADAVSLIPMVGRPYDLLRLSFGYWTEKNLDMAIRLAKQGIKLCARSRDCDPEDKKSELRLKNNLAYFYAAIGDSSNEEEARQLAEECVKRVLLGEEYDAYGKFLATLGLVEIAFAHTADEVEQGIKRCQDAYRLGSDFGLLVEHLAKAKQRLAVLQYAVAPTLDVDDDRPKATEDVEAPRGT